MTDARRATRRRVPQPAPKTRVEPPAAAFATIVPFVGPAAITAVAAAMLAWTWRTWPDPLIDFGREVNFAWELSRGKVLYADVAHISGPLSPYVNALWFRLFGPGILTLAYCNIAIAALVVVLLYRLFLRLGDHLAATAACLVFVVLFASAQFVRIGNYNWVCPYSHELTHGAALGVAGLWALSRYQADGRLRWIAVVGMALGLLVLTKVEVLLAGAVGLGTGLGLTLAIERPGPHRLVRIAGTLVGVALVPIAVTFLCFVRVLPTDEILRWPLGHWRAAARADLVAMPFYREGLGIDDVPANLAKLGVAALWWLAVLAPGIVGAIALRGPGRHRAPAAVGLFVVTALALWWRWPTIAWFDAARPLPLFMLLVLAGSVTALVRHRREPERARRFALQAAAAAFGLAMLAKMILDARVFHYGFVLAMPATLVLVGALLAWVPAAASELGAYGPALRAVALAALVVGVPAHLGAMSRLVAQKVHLVGEGRDLILADDRGPVVEKLLGEVRAHASSAQTLIVAPEGIMVNYIARRENPTPYYQIGPLMLTVFGEDAVLRSLQDHPPDFVALVNKETSHEGARFFGQDYGRRVFAWIQANYRSVAEIGPPPFRDRRFGAVLMERTSAPSATGAP